MLEILKVWSKFRINPEIITDKANENKSKFKSMNFLQEGESLVNVFMLE